MPLRRTRSVARICEQLPTFDVVTLDLEFGIWGASIEQAERHFLDCSLAAKQLIVFAHRVDTDVAKSGEFALAQARIFARLAERKADRPYHIVVHSADEADVLRTVHGFSGVSSHPLAFVTAADKNALRANADAQGFRRRLGFEDDAIVVGLFGAISAYKDNRTVLRALAHLPSRYKLVFVGGAHPFSIRPFKTDENIAGILEEISDIGEGFDERVRFTGVLDDLTFRQAMQDTDIVVLPYHDAGQFASGVGAMAFELGKRIVATHTILFLGFRRAYGDCFEMYDIGNYIELRDRIRFFSAEKATAINTAKDRYTPETMAALLNKVYAGLVDPAYADHASRDKVNALVGKLGTAMNERAIRQGHGALSGDLAHIHKAFQEAVQAQDQLKAEKTWAEESLARSHTERETLVAQMAQVRGKVAALLSLPPAVYRAVRRKVRVTHFNTILDDAARARYEPSIRTLWLMAPDVMTRKIPRANVQQGFMLAAVEELARRRPNPRMLCVGSFEDTAAMALRALGYHVVEIDPALNYGMHDYREAHREMEGKFDIVFSTSVIEHVPDDEEFVADMAAMTAPGGYCVLTCDFNDKWRPDMPKPSTDVRLYGHDDMQRLVRAMGTVALVDTPDWDREKFDFTIWEAGVELRYGFASLVVQKR